MMDLKELFIAMSIKQKQKQKIQTMTTLYDFILIPLNDQIKKYEEVREIAIGQGNDQTTGCLLNYQYFKDHYQLIAVDFSKQKELDSDPGSNQKIQFYEKLETNWQVCTV